MNMPFAACKSFWTKIGLSSIILFSYAGIVVAQSDDAWKATDLKQLFQAFCPAIVLKTQPVTITMPQFVDDGISVPVQVESKLPDTESICLIAKDNPFPLLACFDFSPQAYPIIQTRIRLAKSTTILAIVTSKGRRYSFSKQIQIGKGGCGAGMVVRSAAVLPHPSFHTRVNGGWTDLYIKINHMMPKPDSPEDYDRTNFLREIVVKSGSDVMVKATLGPSLADNPFLFVRYKTTSLPAQVSWRNKKGQRWVISLPINQSDN